MIINTDEEIDLSVKNVIQFTYKNCMHNQILVDESLQTVECGLCKEKLNPIWVLTHLSSSENRYKNRIWELKRYAEKIEEKIRTKCEHCQKMTKIRKG